MKGGKISEQRVLVLYNRPKSSVESEIGVLDEVAAVKDALSILRIDSEAIGVEDLQEAREVLSKSSAGVVFNLVESFSNSPLDACLIPALCEELGKAVTGSSTPSLIKTTDKVIAKGILRAQGIPTPDWQVIGGLSDITSLNHPNVPLIFKPILSDGSEGIYADRSVINPNGQLSYQTKNLVKGLLEIFPFGLVAEEYVGNKEVNITVIEREKGPLVLEMAEIDFSLLPEGIPKIVDYPAKWQKSSYAYKCTPRVIPARLPQDMREQLTEVGLRCFELFGCKDYIRIDIRLDDESFWVIDINTNPDISYEAGLAAALEASKIDYVDFISDLLKNATRRKEESFRMPHSLLNSSNCEVRIEGYFTVGESYTLEWATEKDLNL